MDNRIKMLDALSEKTKNEIELFVINSYLSEDDSARKKFYDILHKVMVESLLSAHRKLKK